MIQEHFLAVPRGGILYDAVRLRKPEAAMFTREYWSACNRIDEFAGGRGSVSVLHAAEGDWILRHYRRGGFAARISADRYLWLGANATRSFREWRLLAELVRRGLPVPAPVAASYVRHGATYRADIITARLTDALTLAAAIASGALDREVWARVGRTIGRFHAAGVHHADLNAHNVMLVGDDVYLLDFDRGRIRARGAWEREVIARLRRSLDKLKSQRAGLRFTDADWQALLAGAGEG